MTIEKRTYRSGPFHDFIAQGTQVGNVLYLSGQVGIDRDRNTPTSIADQAKVAYTNMQDVLAQFGADMSNIVDETFLVISTMPQLVAGAWVRAGETRRKYVPVGSTPASMPPTVPPTRAHTPAWKLS